MKVYVLTVDCYEDEEVVGIFTSLDKINKFKERFPTMRIYNKPIEFELDNIPERPNNKFVYQVSYNCKNELSSFEFDFNSIKFIDTLLGGDNDPLTYVWASDKLEAIKKGYEIFKKHGVLK